MTYPHVRTRCRATALPFVLLTTLASCHQVPDLVPTTAGTQSAAPVSQMAGQVDQGVRVLALRIGTEDLSATITPAAATSTGTSTTNSSFVLPLPQKVSDDSLTRFSALFLNNCKGDLSGDYLARLYVAATLESGDKKLTAVSATKSSDGTLLSTTQVLYLYSDRTTYLRGLETCTALAPSGTRTATQTGFELNLFAGWNRITLTTASADDSAGTLLYASTPRVAAGSATTAEVWASR